MLHDYVKVFRAIGEPTRIRIVKLLATRDMHVCELEVVLAMSQPRISLHIRTLREANLIIEEREGRKIRLSLNKSRLYDALEGYKDFISTDISTLIDFSVEFTRLKGLESNSIVECCIRGGDSG